MGLAPVPRVSRELDLRDLVQVVWSERVRILVVTLIGGVLALGISFLFPDWFRAQATILPPEDTDLFTNMSLAQRALTKFPAFGILGDYFTPADVFKAILKSRTVQDAVIDRFNLERVYKLKSHEKTLKELKGHYDVKLASEGTITVSVEDRDPKQSREVQSREVGQAHAEHLLEAAVPECDRPSRGRRSEEQYGVLARLERRIELGLADEHSPQRIAVGANVPEASDHGGASSVEDARRAQADLVRPL